MSEPDRTWRPLCYCVTASDLQIAAGACSGMT
jgi:hypothetical protein